MPYASVLKRSTSWGDVENYITMCVNVLEHVCEQSFASRTAVALLMRWFSSVKNKDMILINISKHIQTHAQTLVKSQQ